VKVTLVAQFNKNVAKVRAYWCSTFLILDYCPFQDDLGDIEVTGELHDMAGHSTNPQCHGAILELTLL
jgi:hypothetical protein